VVAREAQNMANVSASKAGGIHMCPCADQRKRWVSESPLNANRDDAIDILWMLGLLAIVITVHCIGKQRKWPVPDAILTMAVSIVAGLIVGLVNGDLHAFRRLDETAANQFLLIWLAPIMYAEGYDLRTKDFFDNIVRILAHAFLGTILSAIVVGLIMFYIPPLVGVVEAEQMNLAECLTFGALISATDPVTTLAIFKDQRLADRGLAHLYYTVLGESIFNDAVGITLFASFSKLVKHGKTTIGLEEVITMTIEFSWTFIASMLIGLALGMAMPLVLKHTPLEPLGHHDHESENKDQKSDKFDDLSESDSEEFRFNVPEMGLAVLIAMLPYLVAEALDFSGIVAIMFAGITSRYYAHHNLSKETRKNFLPILELFAQLCETYVFIILGLGVVFYQGHYQAPLVLAAIVGCLIGRALHVYPFAWTINRCTSALPLQRNEQHMMWFAGLRGAIAFICAFSFPETEHSKHRYTVICITIVIVVCSLLLLGWPTTTIMRWLDLQPAGQATEDAAAISGFDRRRSEQRTSTRTTLPLKRYLTDPTARQPSDITESLLPQPSSCGAGLFKALDRPLRRVLMTRDARVATNKRLLEVETRGRASTSASVDKLPG